jgi:Ca2+-binding RTX toxin-like protein
MVDVYNGGSGSEQMKGMYDEMYGGGGDDYIASMKDGWSYLEGGPGNDRVAVATFGVVYGGGGNDVVVGGFWSQNNEENALYGGDGDDWVHGFLPEN